tara:strand:- start:6831 stop:7481 length:651 start_codon:yes stop_codon:yes gene_type:complete
MVNKRIKKKLKGGVAPSCIENPSVNKYLGECHQANKHNQKGGAKNDDDDGNWKAFEPYLDKLAAELGVSKRKQSGGGYSVDPNEMIGGQSVIKGFDDCCPPAIVGGNLVTGKPGQSVCGVGRQVGGKKKSKENKSSKKVKGRGKVRSKSKDKRKSKRTSKKTKRAKRAKRGIKFGGGRSKPAAYPKSFETDKSNLSGRVDDKNFDETQPSYSVNAI